MGIFGKVKKLLGIDKSQQSFSMPKTTPKLVKKKIRNSYFETEIDMYIRRQGLFLRRATEYRRLEADDLIYLVADMYGTKNGSQLFREIPTNRRSIGVMKKKGVDPVYLLFIDQKEAYAFGKSVKGITKEKLPEYPVAVVWKGRAAEVDSRADITDNNSLRYWIKDEPELAEFMDAFVLVTDEQKRDYQRYAAEMNKIYYREQRDATTEKTAEKSPEREAETRAAEREAERTTERTAEKAQTAERVAEMVDLESLSPRKRRAYERQKRREERQMNRENPYQPNNSFDR